MKQEYDASAIEVLKGLDPVRKRPGMYTETDCPNHLAYELIDNSVDEAISGFASSITVTMHANGALTVQDDGRGMPVDMHHKEKVSGVELIMTRLHAGGKFSNKNYTFSGGLHGVGVSVVNALSTQLDVYIKRDGNHFIMQFQGGEVTKKLTTIAKVSKRDTGTTICFSPDPKYFDSISFDWVRLRKALHSKAILCPGLMINLINEADDEKNESWCYSSGLQEYLSTLLIEEEYFPTPVYVDESKKNSFHINWAVAWGDEVSLVHESYVNLIPTEQGGTHVNGFRVGLTDAVREFCEFRALIAKGLKLVPDDIFHSCAFVLAIKMVEPQFSGQTKGRLVSRDAGQFVQRTIKEAFSLWLNQNTQEATSIASIALENAERRLKSKKTVKRKKNVSGPALPGKLADCSSNDLEHTELFLVEGDSAGGSAKQARDKSFQAIMPLRGKILNTWELHSSELISREVLDISTAVGVCPGSDDLSNLRYGKICILADADADGAHIATLLCALFFRHFNVLIESGRVYIALPPLYRINAGKKIYYALDDNDRDQIMMKIKKENQNVKINIQRFKGLGEMNPLQLRETTMARQTRRMIRLTVSDNDLCHSRMDLLLAKKRSPERKLWLGENGSQVKIL